jgi:hypothetical protein
MACSPVVGVWDGVLSQEELATLHRAGTSREHSFTAVFDRKGGAAPRTLLESSLCALLTELGDDSRFLEYWCAAARPGRRRPRCGRRACLPIPDLCPPRRWRADWISMGAHRDVDEALCRSMRIGSAGVQRCPTHGHVLYVSVDASVRGPTALWEEAPPAPAAAAAAATAGGSACAGAPRALRALHVIPARAGRLLRFKGEAIHAVPKPALQWVSEMGGRGGGEVGLATRRQSRCSTLQLVLCKASLRMLPPTLPSCPPLSPPSPVLPPSVMTHPSFSCWRRTRTYWSPAKHSPFSAHAAHSLFGLPPRRQTL